MADNTGCIYAKTGGYKTANLGMVAMYVYEKLGLISRYVTSDGGSFRPIQGLIDIGIIKPLNIVNDPDPIPLLRAIIEDRYWPTEINDKAERTSGKVKRDLNGIGAYLFEGITSIAELIMSRYRGKATAMNPAFKETIKSNLQDSESNKALDAEEIGSFSMDAYGLAQQEIQSLLIKSWSLPVDTVWWSAHEAEGKDDLSKDTLRGVALVGNKGTSRIGKKIGTLIHGYQVPVEKKIGTGPSAKTETIAEMRYYFQPHPDLTFPKIMWEAKPRVPSQQIDELLKRFPGGYFVPSPTEGLNMYLKVEDELLSKQVKSLEEWKLKADKEREKKEKENLK